MRNFFIIIAFSFFCTTILNSCGDTDIFSFTEKNIHVEKAGGLANGLFLSNLNAVTELTVVGVIDSRDFKTIRDRLPKLKELDLSKATIVGYKGFEGTGGEAVYEYPENVIPVNSFYNPATTIGKTSLIKITLPLSLKSIGASAFTGCTGLTTLSFPSTLHKIEDRAFARCSGLAGKLTFPALVDTIGYSAFTYCDGITSLELPSSLISIGESAFNGCSGLSGTLNIPTNVKIINDRAFESCSGIETVNIPASVETFGYYVFQGCNCPVNVAVENPNLSSTGGVLFDNSQMTLKYFPPVKTGKYEIPTSVLIIENAAFANCRGLTSIVIPTTVMLIGDFAFQNCSGLTGTFDIPGGVFSIGIFVFEGCNGISAFNVAPDNTLFSSLDGVLFDTTQTSLIQFPLARTGIYSIPVTVSTINSGAFLDGAGLASVSIPASVTAIGDRAFMNCTGLTTIREYATTPIAFSNDVKTTSWSVFDNVNKMNCTLYVPAGTLKLYQAANQWKNFINIVEM